MPELGALLDFADFYGVSLDYLLGRDLMDGDDNVVKNYKKGRKWHLSEYLREIVSGISWRCDEEIQNGDGLDREKKKSNKLTEYDENMNILKSLLEQAIILARRVEDKKSSWYRY